MEAVEKEAIFLYRQHGRMPSELWDQTPHDLYDVMFHREKAAMPLPPLEGLKKANQLRAQKGLPPVMGKLFESVLKSVPNAKGGKRGR